MNIQQLMRRAQKLQKQMAENKIKMEGASFEGSAGGGGVKVAINGLYKMISVFIDPAIIDKNEAELLQDMVVAAYNNAKEKADDANRNGLGEMGGLL
ncbi:MAG: YbaB/EbfC family nucleoid-associated protein [Rickettsiales bacterium]|jgi:DNA-binding YbaB/EbfC family protein|nr:YbaB/EbfC family nucleoid-associated protein [Rickettsiales bacterium]